MKVRKDVLRETLRRLGYAVPLNSEMLATLLREVNTDLGRFTYNNEPRMQLFGYYLEETLLADLRLIAPET